MYVCMCIYTHIYIYAHTHTYVLGAGFPVSPAYLQLLGGMESKLLA